LVHRSAQYAIDNHENNDEYLENAEVELPKGVTVCIVFKEKRLKEKDDAQNREKHVSGCEVHEVESKAECGDA
jgi:hypothetical protein